MKTNQFSGALSAPVGKEVNFPTINVNALTEQVNELQRRYSRELCAEDITVRTPADAWYKRAVLFAGLGIMMPPFFLGTAYCVVMAKRAEKGGRA